MAPDIQRELITYLAEMYAIEQSGLDLLTEAIELARDEQIAALYRAHCLQTEGHVRSIIERLEAHGSHPSAVEAATVREADRVRIASATAESRPTSMAISTYAFESLEIAAYHLLRGVAKRAGDHDTIATVDRILDEEEEAAEMMAGTLDRVLEVALGESPQSPVSRMGTDPIDRRRRSSR